MSVSQIYFYLETSYFRCDTQYSGSFAHSYLQQTTSETELSCFHLTLRKYIEESISNKTNLPNVLLILFEDKFKDGFVFLMRQNQVLLFLEIS